MKTRSILSALLGLALMAGGCASDEFERGGVSPTSPGVHVRLTGAAAPAARTRATVEATDGERTVNSVLAVLFDTHEGFYKTVPATRVGETDEYTFIVEKDATYDIWLVANASDELRSALEGIGPGTPMENAEGVSCLESIVAGQAPDADGEFLMVSKYSEKVTTRITETQSVGEVHMIRLAARFDLLNKAEGVTVKSITFKNRTVRSAVLTPNTMPTQTDWYEETPYEVNVTGDPENGNPWEGHIYTYENNSVAGDFMRPELTITYTEGDDTQVKTHTVELVDPNSTAGTAMAVKRNNLYRIILTKATKLDFDLEVLDWEEADAIENPDLPLVLPKNVQDSLNRQLLVYDLFTEFNVKELDLSNKKVVSFYDSNKESSEGYLTLDTYYSHKQLRDLGLMNEDVIFTDANNENIKYRIPTQGELALLVPYSRESLNLPIIKKSGKTVEDYPMFTPEYNSIIMNPEEFEETIYFHTDNTGVCKTNEDITSSTKNGIKAKSILKMSDRITDYPYWDPKTYACSGTDPSCLFPVRACYGLRFKDTDQYSAYKWEYKRVKEGADEFYISIKIKALPKESNATIYDIVDNHSFWSEGYIEINFPTNGMYTTDQIKEDSKKGYRQGNAVYIMSRNISPVSKSHQALLSGYHYGFKTFQQNIITRIGIRLIKVKSLESE